MRLGEGSSRAKIDFGRRGDDAGAVDPQALGAADQAELHRVPVEPRQIAQHAQSLGAQAALAVGLHVVGEDRVGQHRHVAEDIVEDVRLLQVVELVGLADELAGRKAPVGQMVEEHLVGHQTRHRDDAPAGALLQIVAQAAEIGDVLGIDGEVAHALNELVAGSAGQQFALTLVQGFPDAVLFRRVAVPALVDGPVGTDRASRFTGSRAMSGRFHRLLPKDRIW